MAIEMGQIETQSYLNEPFKARLSINDVDAINLQDIKFSLASHSEYKKLLGSARPDYLQKLNFKINLGPRDQHLLQINSQQRVIEPIITLLLKVSEKQSSFIKQYTLLMDPELETSSPIPTQNPSSTENFEPAVDETPVAISAEPGNASIAKTIKVKDRSISIIAQNSALHERYSVYQIMRAFYLVNPDMFEYGNIDKLMAGSTLVVPDESLIAEVPRQKAINFVYAVSRDNPARTTQLDPRPARQPGAQAQVKSKQEPTEQHLLQVSSKNSMVKDSDKMNQSMQRDLSEWRSVAREFADLSGTLESQNQALQTQNNALKSITRDLTLHEDQILQLGLRLNYLESLQQNINGETTEPTPAASRVFTDQNRVIETQSNTLQDINSELIEKNAQISELKSQVLTLTEINQVQLTRPLPEQPAPEPQVINDSLIAAPKIITYLPQQSSDNFKLWLSLFILAVVVLFALREWIWSRRLNALKPQQKTAVKSKSVKKETSTYKPRDEDTGEIELKDLNSPSKAHDKYLDTAADQSKLQLEANTVNEVKVEIDVLLAYEQYNEAMELLKTSKEKFGHEPWLDIKELEVLASSGQCDVFFARFNETKAELEAELPEAWEKVEKMRMQLCKEFKISAVH